MIRSVALPCLPGYNFNNNLGKVKFNKSQVFEKSNNICQLTDRALPWIGGSVNILDPPSMYPSTYSRKEFPEMPAWITFDKQILRFTAYFQETLQENAYSPFRIRIVNILFFLSDGTVKIMEPHQENSGATEGLIVNRQRVRLPPPRHQEFFDLLDFNVGREIELYGRMYKVVDCDNFTRVFLNRIGIAVPDSLKIPEDPYVKTRIKTKEGMLPKKPIVKKDTLGKFLENDKKILRFFGYWDDRATDKGLLHELHIHFYLSDDTIEIKEILDDNSGTDGNSMFLKRGPLPKNGPSVIEPGMMSHYTILNVHTRGQRQWLMRDTLNCGLYNWDIYTERDLAIGAVLNVYGRCVILTDMDPFTKEYYLAKYGVSEFPPHPWPEVASEGKEVEWKLPPYNGFGSYEDSASNCRYIELKPPRADTKAFLTKDREGLDGKILRFKALLLNKSDNNINIHRQFIICFYAYDKTTSVYEVSVNNLGFDGGLFYRRCKMVKPGEELLGSDPPAYFEEPDFWIGNILELNAHKFLLIDADEYAFRYMEVNCHEFDKSDINKIIIKLREALRPIYKEFVCQYLCCSSNSEKGTISYEHLKEGIKKVMGNKITEHELMTIARYYNASCVQDRHSRTRLKSVIQTELRRFLFQHMDRLHESIRYFDPHCTGFVRRESLYKIIRAASVPLDKVLINALLDKLKKNDKCEIEYADLMDFLDYRKCTVSLAKPINIKYEFSFSSERPDNKIREIDYEALLKVLDLEKTITQQSS